MIKPVIHDEFLLSRKSLSAAPEDISVADDLADTLKANSEKCVGMAANMIGVLKRIIVFDDNGKITEMFNPEIIKQSEPFETEEGCLSLTGVRKTKRYKKIKVRWQTRDFQIRIKTYTGFAAQIIQHEIDHFDGKII